MNNLISLKGTIKRDIEKRINSKGEDYYFTFLSLEDQKNDLPIFLWNPSYNLALKAEQDLIEDIEIILWGNYNKDQTCFYFSEWEVEELETF